MAGKPRSEIAFVWRNGRIEFGTKVPTGAKPIASGPPKTLRDFIEAHARPGWSGELWAPGVSGAEDAQEASNALQAWLNELPRDAGVDIGVVKPDPGQAGAAVAAQANERVQS